MYLELPGPDGLEHVLNAIRSIAEKNILLSLSTYAQGELWTSTVFYAIDGDFNFYFVSDPETRHCRMMSENPTVSASIYSTDVVWGTNIQGVQLVGVVKQLALPQTMMHGLVYLRRFPVAQSVFSSPEMLLSDKMNSRFYQIAPKLIQLYDEVTLSGDNPIQRVVFD